MTGQQEEKMTDQLRGRRVVDVAEMRQGDTRRQRSYVTRHKRAVQAKLEAEHQQERERSGAAERERREQERKNLFRRAEKLGQELSNLQYQIERDERFLDGEPSNHSLRREHVDMVRWDASFEAISRWIEQANVLLAPMRERAAELREQVEDVYREQEHLERLDAEDAYWHSWWENWESDHSLHSRGARLEALYWRRENRYPKRHRKGADSDQRKRWRSEKLALSRR